MYMYIFLTYSHAVVTEIESKVLYFDKSSVYTTLYMTTSTYMYILSMSLHLYSRMAT